MVNSGMNGCGVGVDARKYCIFVGVISFFKGEPIK